jgi:translation initiation factor 1
MSRKKKVERGEGWELIRACKACGQPPHTCRCAPETEKRADPKVRLEKRKGREVTVVSGLGLDRGALKALAKDWKRKLGVGGTVQGDDVELQGDRREEVLVLLEEVENLL